MNAEDKPYWDYKISKWRLEKIFGKDNIPENIYIEDDLWKEAELYKVTEYIDEEFANWVSENCEFLELTEEDIENGIGLSDSEVGDKVLSEQGLKDFNNKSMEYKRKLEEATGFTYDFKGGLIWE